MLSSLQKKGMVEHFFYRNLFHCHSHHPTLNRHRHTLKKPTASPQSQSHRQECGPTQMKAYPSINRRLNLGGDHFPVALETCGLLVKNILFCDNRNETERLVIPSFFCLSLHLLSVILFILWMHSTEHQVSVVWNARGKKQDPGLKKHEKYLAK